MAVEEAGWMFWGAGDLWGSSVRERSGKRTDQNDSRSLMDQTRQEDIADDVP